MHTVHVQNIKIGKGHPLVLISGPCVIESEQSALDAAAFLYDLTQELGIPFIYKSSYDKANRSSYSSFRGPGIHEGLKILEKVKAKYHCPVLSDIHTVEEVEIAKEVLDVLQIPAFLCRQTDLVTACAKTKCAINVKKGQFLAPHDMKNVVDKIEACGNKNIILTERGYTFGYNNLVVDMRAIPIMQSTGYPVCFDGTHSVQLPGGLGTASSGQREMIPCLSKAAIAAGANAIFLESHPNPKEAKSDAMSVMDFKDLKPLLKTLKAIYAVI
jgi:2-dehydro-3-deoxyphosphooctonate aldolase (KDO 8-P synthase)